MGKKHVCGNLTCKWCGDSDDVLKTPNPFKPDKRPIWACPKCKSVESLYVACDEPGCCEFGEYGCMTAEGWRITCKSHRPECPDD